MLWHPSAFKPGSISLRRGHHHIEESLLNQILIATNHNIQLLLFNNTDLIQVQNHGDLEFQQGLKNYKYPEFNNNYQNSNKL
ncbi:unnamed protein product [Ambrosiozyma monospora]|uniref:Unnamed protein product n=1 Tax=Ambrosiozyma monospora TaxID=43982 RepID=A0ACB5SQX7_AMBMO|nr:unnamed protein product [Ambrosiozyma monospora]